ncbi:hypothetical protein GCM10027176_79720 [Actinoallomurus bryophytorum]
MGSSARTLGPAVNPSRDIDTSSTTLLIARLLRSGGAAIRRRHRKVGAAPAVSTPTTETAGTGVFPAPGIGRSLVMLTGFGGN